MDMKKTILRLALTLVAGSFAAGHALPADLVVSAAASLTNAFNEIGKQYEQARPGTKVLFNFAGSGQLMQQIARGAPVDVFASADQETMDRAEKQNLIVRASRHDFVGNSLVVIVPSDSSAKVQSLEDLAAPEIRRVALSNPETVPVGRYARQSLEEAGQWEAVKSKMINTSSVRQSLDYVARGEVDAAFVYVTDALIMPGRVKVAFECSPSKPILYPVAAIKGNGNEKSALAFIAFLGQEPAKNILRKYGFVVR
jgi:molybdate transport system substrate-binding protein